MNEVCAVFKGILDPLFIIFILLIVSFVVFVRNVKQKSDSLVLLFCLILLYGAGIAPAANYLCYYLEKDYMNHPAVETGNIDAIVVLGCGTKDIHALNTTWNSEMESLRVLHAVEVYHRVGAKYFICSGAGDDKMSQAEAMAKLAEKWGVPRERIRLEPNSKSTAQNALEVGKMFAHQKITIGLVTSAFHMKRSEKEFKKYFAHVVPLPAHYLYSSPGKDIAIRYMPQSKEIYKTSLALKEIIAQIWYNAKNMAR